MPKPIVCGGREDFLACDKYVDFCDPAVLSLARELSAGEDEQGRIRRAFHFVRDGIAHTWDAKDARVTVSASDVLREKVGICWAKSNLLAALLRAMGIPAGFCYQRLRLGAVPGKFCVHALNAVLLPSGEWRRLDARGNKKNVFAEFYEDREQLAFTVHEALGECDYPFIRPAPEPSLMRVLEENTDALYMYLHCLPQSLI